MSSSLNGLFSLSFRVKVSSFITTMFIFLILIICYCQYVVLSLTKNKNDIINKFFSKGHNSTQERQLIDFSDDSKCFWPELDPWDESIRDEIDTINDLQLVKACGSLITYINII